jgi:hypothetical protein
VKHFFAFFLFLFCAASAFAYPEYSAFSGSNCMACHVGPIGGFGRKPTSQLDPGYITDKFSMSGDLRFMFLYDARTGNDDRVVLFPMEGALHFAYLLKNTLTIAASQDFGTLREMYAMIHNTAQTLYARAGFFTLPYGLFVADHTSFIKEGRVESGARNFEEVGVGAKLFGARYKDSGIEVGYNGSPWFVNLAMTAGVIGQEARSLPNNQGGSKRAITRRGGFLTKHASLGASMYTNDNEIEDRRILRYGAFGWLSGGPFALLFEHDEGEDEQFTVSGSTQISASYVELVYSFHTPVNKWRSYLKARYERLDPNRSLSSDVLERWVASFQTSPAEYVNIEAFYRFNHEQPVERSNDDVAIQTHFYF